jgi:hypothetical protein
MINWHPTKSLQNFGVRPKDPGYIYLVENNEKYKIGRSLNPKKRMQDARTWIPNLNIIGIKPFWNHRNIETLLHLGFAHAWFKKEWFSLPDEGYRWSLVENFMAFDNADINRNSINFIYWFNGEGMADFVAERARQGLSVRQFLLNEVSSKK